MQHHIEMQHWKGEGFTYLAAFGAGKVSSLYIWSKNFSHSVHEKS